MRNNSVFGTGATGLDRTPPPLRRRDSHLQHGEFRPREETQRSLTDVQSLSQMDRRPVVLQRKPVSKQQCSLCLNNVEVLSRGLKAKAGERYLRLRDWTGLLRGLTDIQLPGLNVKSQHAARSPEGD